MNSKSYLGIIGAILVIAGALSPMLRIPIIGNWNYLDIDTVLASVVFILAGLGLIASLLKRPGLVKFSGWATLIVVVFTLIAVYFKVNDYFSFIPFKKLAAAASGIVKYKWIGWIILLTGSVVMIFAGRKERKLVD
jgi:ABC-type Na+ efflux pump permease subunit